MNNNAVLQAIGVGCERGYRQLFGGFDLSLQPGQALQLAGANGAGKTTLLKTLCGLRRPTAGQVWWRGLDVHAQPNVYTGEMAYIGHENALNPDLTPQENLRMLSRQFGTEGNIPAALASMGLPKSLQRPCRLLSAGQRRRVALARLGLGDALLWILDEPAAALDASARDLLTAQIAKHIQAGGMAIFTTHEPLTLSGITPQQITLQR